MSAEIVKLSGAAFCLAPSFGGLLVMKNAYMPLSTALGRISRERFKRGSRNFTPRPISPATGPTNMPDTTSAVSPMAEKYN